MGSEPPVSGTAEAHIREEHSKVIEADLSSQQFNVTNLGELPPGAFVFFFKVQVNMGHPQPSRPTVAFVYGYAQRVVI